MAGPKAFFWPRPVRSPATLPIGSNQRLVGYLLQNSGFHIVQHGLHHDYMEFERDDRSEIRRRLERGARLLREAGFPRPQTFVAPYDKFSRVSLAETAGRFRVVSSGWYESRRLPVSWWPKYFLKKSSVARRIGGLAGRCCFRIPAAFSPATARAKRCWTRLEKPSVAAG